MDIWKYAPGFIARPVIRGLKKVRRTNDYRRKFLDLKRGNNILEGMLVDSDQTAAMMADENKGLKVELETRGMILNDIVGSVEKLKKSYQEHVAAALTGERTYARTEGMLSNLGNSQTIGEGLLAPLNINEGLVELARKAQRENGATREKNENLKQANFKYRVAAAVGNANVGRFPAFAYIDGHVYGTPKFEKYCDKNFSSVRIGLESDAELATALSEGRGVERCYNDMKVVFLPRKKDDVEVGYIVPDKRESRAGLFVKAGVRAAKQLRKTLGKDYDFGEISFA